MRIREARVGDAAAIARVHVQTWRTTYRGMLPDAYLDDLEKSEGERRHRMWERIIAGGGFLYVAEVGGEVVGFVNAGPTRDVPAVASGEIYALYVLKAYQKTGLGKRLFSVARAAFDSVSLWVIRGNPTEGFYRHMGGVADIAKEESIAEQAITELRYIWVSEI